MMDQLYALYELQELDVKIGQIRASLTALTGARALKQQHGAAQSKADAARAKLQELETELKDNELKLKSIDEKRAGVEKRLYSGAIISIREMQAMEKEVEFLKEQQGALDGRVLELYDQVEATRAEAQSVEATVAGIEKQIAEALARESDDRARLESELAATVGERDEAVKGVTDKALLARYEAVRKKTGTTGIAKVGDGKCGGCHVAVLPFTVRKLTEDKGMELCENCGRILML